MEDNLWRNHCQREWNGKPLKKKKKKKTKCKFFFSTTSRSCLVLSILLTIEQTIQWKRKTIEKLDNPFFLLPSDIMRTLSRFLGGWDPLALNKMPPIKLLMGGLHWKSHWITSLIMWSRGTGNSSTSGWVNYKINLKALRPLGRFPSTMVISFNTQKGRFGGKRGVSEVMTWSVGNCEYSMTYQCCQLEHVKSQKITC